MAATCLVAIGIARANADSFSTIPVPTGGSSGSATAISADGSTVIGTYIDSGNDLAGFYWSGGGSASDLGFLGAPFNGTIAAAVSANGMVVVGTSHSQAFRWTQAGGIVGIPFLPGGFFSAALGVSGDGSIVVGQSDATNFPFNGGEAFYWTAATGSIALGTLDTHHNFGASSSATAISTNGQVIVGYSTSNSYSASSEAFRWTLSGGMVGLGSLTGPGATAYSRANAVNADGSVIVGQSSTNTLIDPIFLTNSEAFRWTQIGGMVGLGGINPTDTASNALAVNADGSVVVGYSTDNSYQNHAFRWTQATGMKSVQSLLTTAGVNLTGWNLDSATGVSADGTVMVGSGTDNNSNQQAWIARYSPTMGAGLTTLTNVAQSFAGLSTLGQTGNGHLDNELGTQGEVASDHACPACAFAYGSGGTVPGDPFGAGALGAKIDIAQDTALGASVGAQVSRSSLVYDGSMSTRGGLGSLFIARLPETGLQFIAAITGERFAADITRGYFNGNSLASSSGSTNGYGYGALLRAGWSFNPAAAWRLTPFAAYSQSRVHYDGWTETTGVFPASFDAIDQTARTLRLGGSARYSWTQQTWAWAQIDWAHHFDNTESDITGHLIGLFTMTVPGNEIDRDYVETTLGMRMPLNETAAISTSATAVTSPNTPASFLGRVIVSQQF